MSERILCNDSEITAAESMTAVAIPQRGEKLRGAAKVARIPVKIVPQEPQQRLRKPAWIRAQFPGTPEVMRLKQILRDNHLHTVCEEASCPNLGNASAMGRPRL